MGTQRPIHEHLVTKLFVPSFLSWEDILLLALGEMDAINMRMLSNFMVLGLKKVLEWIKLHDGNRTLSFFLFCTLNPLFELMLFAQDASPH